MTQQRESFVFYRSFKEGISELSDSEKLVMYEAISDYALDRVEPELTGFPKMLFKLIRPQLDANFRRWENGCNGGAPKGNQNARKQPKNNQDSTKKQPKTTKKQANDNVNVNVNVNDNALKEENNKKKEIQPMTEEELAFMEGMKEKYPRVMSLKKPLTLKQYQSIIEEYSPEVVKYKLEDMENYGALLKKDSANLTLRNWLRRDNSKI